MIKDSIERILLVICLMTFPFYTEVYADQDKDLANSINYEITSFEITDKGIIKMTGWSFIDHADNYGGLNLKTYIIAYTGSWNNGWNSNYNTCVKNGKCLVYETTASKIEGQIEDAYYIRCTNDSCNPDKKIYYHNEVKKGKSYKDYCTKSGSHCTYYNIGFTISPHKNIKISDLEKKFGNNEVKFRILSRVKTNYDWNGKKNQKTTSDSTDIGVLSQNCNTVFGKKCTNNGVYKSQETTTISDGEKVIKKENNKTSITTTKIITKERYEVTVGGVNNTVIFTAVSARRFKTQDGIDSEGNFTTGRKYNISAKGNRQQYNNYKGNNKGTFFGRRYKLNDEYWAWSAWIKTTGKLSIKLKKDTQEKTNTKVSEYCDNFYCVGGNCDYTPDNCNYKKPASLKNINNKNDSYNKCTNKEFNASTESLNKNSEYYYRIDDSYIDKNFGKNIEIPIGESDVIRRKKGSTINGKSESYYYIPLTFKYIVNYNIKSNFQITNNFTDKQSIKSGRHFNFGFKYTLSTKWNENFEKNQTYFDTVTSMYNTYNDKIKLNIRNTSQDGNKLIYTTVYISLKEGETIYKLNENNQFEAVKYDINLYKTIAKQEANKVIDNDIDFDVIFSDSNDKRKTVDNNQGNDDAGTFNLIRSNATNEWPENKELVEEYEYNINQAYYKNNGDNYGYYYYVDKSKNSNYTKSDARNAYFIPIALKTGDIFKFKIKGNNISNISDAKISYNATCAVIAKNDFKQCPEGECPSGTTNSLTYRPINTTDPFPSNKYNLKSLPKNWQEYYDKNGLTRLYNSYNNKSYVTKILDKELINKLKYDANDKYGTYNQFKDITINGNSKLIRAQDEKNFLEKKSVPDINHCKAGKFDDTCDKAQGSR